MDFDRDGFYREVGLRLQLLRKSRGLTQQQVGEAIGVSRATYASVESGRQTLALDVAWRMVVFFGVPFDRITPEPVPTRGSVSDSAGVPSTTEYSMEAETKAATAT